MSKGQGLSMNVIIVAAIALLVLVVLIAIFSGRMGSFNRDLNEQTGKLDCPGAMPLAADGCPANDQLLGNYDVEGGHICCAT